MSKNKKSSGWEGPLPTENPLFLSRKCLILNYKHQTDFFVKLKSSPFAIVGVNYQSVSGKYKSNININTNKDMIAKDL